MRKRIILIVVVLLVLGLIVGGVMVYARRNEGWRLLERTKLAVKAGKYADAVDLAEKYAAKYPQRWEGYRWQAIALLRQGEYDRVKTFLQQIEARTDVDVDRVEAKTLLADAYSHPARRALSARRLTRDVKDLGPLDEQIAQLIKSNEAMAEATRLHDAAPADKQDKAVLATIKEGVGVNHLNIIAAYEQKAAVYRNMARTAEAARNPEEAKKQNALAEDERRKSEPFQVAAAKALLEAVRLDPSREEAATELAKIALRRQDKQRQVYQDPKLRTEVIEALLPALLLPDEDKDKDGKLRAALAATKCPEAAMMLVLDAREGSGVPSRLAMEKAAVDLTALGEKHPDLETLKLQRAQLAARLGRFDQTLTLCDEIIAKNPGHKLARLLRGNALFIKGDMGKAKDALAALKTEERQWAAPGLAYARAVMAGSRVAAAQGDMDRAREQKELAMTEMRRVAGLDATSSPGAAEGNSAAVADALAFLAGTLLADGFGRQAHQDASKLYEWLPDWPLSVNLYVRTAIATDQKALARTVLDKAAKDHPNDPAMLNVVAEGLKNLGDKASSEAGLKRVADSVPTDEQQCLAVAGARRELGRRGEAETLLLQWIERTRPAVNPAMAFELGRLYLESSRFSQAVDQFQAAALNDPENAAYKRMLAKALFESGRLEDAERILDQTGPGDAEAKLMRFQIRLARGEGEAGEDEVEGLLQSSGGALEVALANLRARRYPQCIEICQGELKKNPDQPHFRWALARALVLSGQKDQAVGEYKQVLAAEPGSLRAYAELALIVALDGDVSKLRAVLADVAGVRADLMGLACGQVLERQRRFEPAAKAYGAVANDAATPPDIRAQARSEYARALALSGKVDESLKEYDRLAAEKDWAVHANVQKARLLLAAGRRDPARPVLDQLAETAMKEQTSVTWLRPITQLLAAVGDNDKALALCKAFQKRYLSDPEPYMVEAAVLVGAQRPDEAVNALEQAIVRQPANLSCYLLLTELHNRSDRPVQAQDMLKRLADLGPTGKVMALTAEGRLFAGWGLHEQAADRFQQLSKAQDRNPAIDLELGRSLARLGQRKEAENVLKGIPVYSRAHVPAQMLIAALAETPDAQLKVLTELDQRAPGRMDVLEQRMSVLMANGRNDEAVKVYRDFAQKVSPERPLPSPYAFIALRAMLQAGDRKAAEQFAADMARQTKVPQWQIVLAVIRSFSDPAGVKDALPAPEAADRHQTLIGLAAAVQAKQSERVGQCLSRLEALRPRAGQANASPPLPPAQEVLVALATRDVAKARSLAASKDLPAIVRAQLAELVAHAEKVPEAATENARLLAMSVASDVGLTSLAGEEAMAVLKARPANQMAAGMAMQARAENAQAILDVLQPKDGLVAIMIQASQLTDQKKYDEAAKLMASAIALAGGDREIVMGRATALEGAGYLADALTLYRQVWEASGDPTAGNNAAYLMTLQGSGNPKTLEEAAGIAEKVLQRSGGMAYFRDTLGWIFLLRGDLDRARSELCQAVKALPNSPEVHYHLGLAFAKSGKADLMELARQHLRAAVSLNKALAAQKANTKASDEAAAEATKAMSELAPAKA